MQWIDPWYAMYMKCTLYDTHPIWYVKFRNYSTLGGGGTPISLVHFSKKNRFFLLRLSSALSIPYAATLLRRSINLICISRGNVLCCCKWLLRSKILNRYLSKGQYFYFLYSCNRISTESNWIEFFLVFAWLAKCVEQEPLFPLLFSCYWWPACCMACHWWCASSSQLSWNFTIQFSIPKFEACWGSWYLPFAIMSKIISFKSWQESIAWHFHWW